MADNTVSVHDNEPETVSSEAAPTAPPEDAVVVGACLGRYTIRAHLGGGGMGEVFAAHDPELDRVVALKVLRPELAGRSPEARARFQREAQALARLNHPNVVSVYDVGLVDDRVFVAMELVEGPTLASWLAEAPRGWREVVDVFVAAGRGLEAAHDAGLVHRDFKPSNVMLGDRRKHVERVRVVDFGLARFAGVSDDGEPTATPMLEGTITNTGQALGTPAYMSPEQRLGLTLTARSDQYSFAVALHEALFGARPNQPPPAVARSVPGRLRALLDRALNDDPELRFPSMHELLIELARDPARTRRRWVAAAAGVAIVGIAAFIVIALRPGESVCDVASIDDAWSPAHGERVTKAFEARRSGQGARVAAALDAWSSRWRLARTASCREGGTAAERRHACLDRQRSRMAVLVDGFASGTGSMIDRAFALVLDLPAPETCLGGNVIETMPYPNDPRVAAVVRDLDVARIDYETMRYAEGRVASARALATARELGHPALLAEALAFEAMFATERPDEQRRQQLHEALAEATRARDRHLQATITLRLLGRATVEDNENAVEAILPMARAAVAASDDPQHRLKLAIYEARALVKLNRLADSLAACKRLETLDEPPYFHAEDCRCQAYLSAFQYGPAKASCRAALENAEKIHGKDTAVTYGVLVNLAILHSQLGELEESRVLRERQKQVVATVFGPDSDEMAHSIYGLGTLYVSMDKPEEAKREIEAAVAIWSRINSKPTQSIANARMMLAEIRGTLGDTAAGADEADRALATIEEVLGPTHREVTVLLLKHGYVNLAAGRREVALASFTRCVAIAETSYGATHMLLGFALLSRAQVLVELGRAREALAPAERALSIVSAAETSPHNKAAAHVALGRARLETGDRAGGRALLLVGRELYVKAGSQSDIDKIDKLLRR